MFRPFPPLGLPVCTCFGVAVFKAPPPWQLMNFLGCHAYEPRSTQAHRATLICFRLTPCRRAHTRAQRSRLAQEL